MPKPTKKTTHARLFARIASHLSSRAEWLRRRREPDPRCRAAQLADADECERLAEQLREMIEGSAA